MSFCQQVHLKVHYRSFFWQKCSHRSMKGAIITKDPNDRNWNNQKLNKHPLNEIYINISVLRLSTYFTQPAKETFSFSRKRNLQGYHHSSHNALSQKKYQNNLNQMYNLMKWKNWSLLPESPKNLFNSHWHI